MKFTIITPSFRQFPWLRRCVRSVEDQGVQCEHIVQDASGDAEMEAWLRNRPYVRLFAEKDTGMYDALNRGFDRAQGEIIAWLNCDEQYLPGALARVERWFSEHPGVDILVGDALLLDPAGSLLSFRRATSMIRAWMATDHLYNQTCSIFYRRRIIKNGPRFDLTYRISSDVEWMLRLLKAGARSKCLRDYLATFSVTGENLSSKPEAKREAEKIHAAAPVWLRLLGPAFRRLRHLQKLLRRGYHSGPIRYAVYASADDETRTEFFCEDPTFRHPWTRPLPR